MNHDFIINFKTIFRTSLRTELVFRQSLMYHKVQTILEIIKNIKVFSQMHKCIRVFKSLGAQGNTTVKSMDQGEIKMVKHITKK